MQPKILITSLLMKVKENTKREQMEYEPQIALTYQSIDANPLQSGIQTKYQYPVVTYKCNHSRVCYNLEKVRADLKDPKLLSFTCTSQGCGARITSEEELVKDIRWYANEEFHELVQEAMVIEGKLFNRYYRAVKRYTEFLNDKQIRSQIISMMGRFVEKENSINSLIIENLQSLQSQNAQSAFRTGSNQIISFWAICLQDKVKLTIPVRIIGCKHKECYDITSLLAFQKENPDEKVYYCVADGCYSKLDISNVQTMFTQLSIDLHLLNALKQSPPSCFKFIFNPTTFRIEADVQRKDGFPIDPTIYELFKRRKAEENQQFTIQDYLQFEKNVQQQITNILQQNVAKDLEKKIKCQKYQQAQINMQDKLTGFTVEYPVRCKHTDNFETTCDLRSVIADFVYDKQKSQTDMYRCRLCNQQQNQTYVRIQISNQLYLDQNLFSRMFKDMSYLHNKIFNYDGMSYMRQEFYDKQKFEIEEFKSKLTIKTVEFRNLKCSRDKNVPLQMPLLLKQCPIQSIIDFDTFYNEMKKIQFDLETKGLILCFCEKCNINPITKIAGNVYYHEGFGLALKEFRKTGSKDTSFKYDFQNMSLSTAATATPGSATMPFKGKDGFVDLLNDEDYQNAFKVQQVLGGRHFQILSMSQDIADGISVTHNAQGASGNLEAKRKEMNQYAEQNQQLKKWNFQVNSINLQLNNDLIKINKGNLGDTPTNPG